MTTEYACQTFATLEQLLADKAACDYTESEDGDLLEACLDNASDMLYLLSGGRITGVCERTVRPVSAAQCTNYGTGFFATITASQPYPMLDGSINQYGAIAGWLARYNGVLTIPLRGPNTTVLDVLIDGVPLGVNEYGLLDHRFLHRTSGNWPVSNDLALDDSQDGTWSIRYKFGRKPDTITWQATVEVALSIANDIIGKRTGMPPGVTYANIQGASVTLQEKSQALRDGGSNLPKLARFLGIYAPDGAHRSGVWSPELKHGVTLVEAEGPNGS